MLVGKSKNTETEKRFVKFLSINTVVLVSYHEPKQQHLESPAEL